MANAHEGDTNSPSLNICEILSKSKLFFEVAFIFRQNGVKKRCFPTVVPTTHYIESLAETKETHL